MCLKTENRFFEKMPTKFILWKKYRPDIMKVEDVIDLPTKGS